MSKEQYWTKVSDCLPKDKGKYLVLIKRPDKIGTTIEIAQRYTHKTAVKMNSIDKNFLIKGTVTHWMHLPNKPKN